MGVTDHKVSQSLMDLAEQYEAEAFDLERGGANVSRQDQPDAPEA